MAQEIEILLIFSVVAIGIVLSIASACCRCMWGDRRLATGSSSMPHAARHRKSEGMRLSAKPMMSDTSAVTPFSTGKTGMIPGLSGHNLSLVELNSVATRSTVQPNGARSLVTVNTVFGPDGYRKEDGAWLAGALPDAFASHVAMPSECGRQEPRLVGSWDALLAKAPELESQAYNQIKQCPKCSKMNALCMTICNNCGTDLAQVPVSRAPNLFIGFIFGVDCAPFPLKVSLRLETPGLIVIDDPLAMSRAHLLAMPTDMYVPDIRSLFASPNAGLRLLERLDEAAWFTLTGMLADDDWRAETLSPASAKLPFEDLRKHVQRNFNLPPSQYQLHLQYMLPPLMPQHCALWKRGVHYMKYRNFSYEYVVAGLKALSAAGETLPDAPSMSAADLVQALCDLGVDYDALYEENSERLGESNTFLANFKPEDFEYAVVGDAVCNKKSWKPLPDAPRVKDLEALDKLAMQSYGRPYTPHSGKPSGVYYSHACDPEALPELFEFAGATASAISTASGISGLST